MSCCCDHPSLGWSQATCPDLRPATPTPSTLSAVPEVKAQRSQAASLQSTVSAAVPPPAPHPTPLDALLQSSFIYYQLTFPKIFIPNVSDQNGIPHAATMHADYSQKHRRLAF